MATITELAQKAADNPVTTLLSRVAIVLIAFMALQIWTDGKENHDRVTAILINQAVAEQKLDEAMRRISKIEASDHASLAVPIPNYAALPNFGESK